MNGSSISSNDTLSLARASAISLPLSLYLFLSLYRFLPSLIFDLNPFCFAYLPLIQFVCESLLCENVANGLLYYMYWSKHKSDDGIAVGALCIFKRHWIWWLFIAVSERRMDSVAVKYLGSYISCFCCTVLSIHLSCGFWWHTHIRTTTTTTKNRRNPLRKSFNRCTFCSLGLQ